METLEITQKKARGIANHNPFWHVVATRELQYIKFIIFVKRVSKKGPNVRSDAMRA